ncbi:hypothetical protein GCK72_018725 [Caenorhabditis remanei]|uniref:SPK domain-containing protein n=1 Tax=Caenorhabditis remanei TaxID=31234 RepID=A0A6A5GBR9_CAERE|nr:hypothetical protein GCK72_018725 [Caenorhabditis remanei]KAF1752171.1 hypothetical protein GCK72_018725 [Caenorhabditis remanei]
MEEIEAVHENSQHKKEDEPKPRYFTNEENIQMWEFVYRFVFDPKEGIVEKIREPTPHTLKFWQKYIDETGSKRNVGSLQSRYPKLIKTLHKMPFGTEMKLNLSYSLDLPLEEEFLKTAKEEAFIWMDENKNVEAFEMKTEEQLQKEREAEQLRQQLLQEKQQSAQKKKTPTKRRSSIAKNVTATPTIPATPSAKRVKTMFSKEQDVDIWKFLFGKIFDSKTDKVQKLQIKGSSRALWKEYLGAEADSKAVSSYCSHYQTIIRHLHSMPFDMRMKADLYYALHIPVNSEFLALLKLKTEVKMDEDGCIVEYNSEDLKEKLYCQADSEQKLDPGTDSESDVHDDVDGFSADLEEVYERRHVY